MKKVAIKAERLNDLREEEQFHKALNKILNRDWKEFVKGIRLQHDTSNLRLFKILADLKGEPFVADLKKFMGSTGNKSALLSLTKHPKGILLKDRRYPTIPELMVERFRSSSDAIGAIYIQITPDRWVKFVF